MKKALKILGAIFGVILLIALAVCTANVINLNVINAYVDTFMPVEYEDRLTPECDESGIPYFTTDEEFRVMQLTDVHIGGGFLSHSEDKMAINAVAAMISEEKPDLVIVTGDISFAVPYISTTFNNSLAHSIFIRLMERLGVYWTITLGNHDSEAYNYYGREAVCDFYLDESLKYCLLYDDGELSGAANHVINVKNSKGLITESFYMIDTHAYTDDDPLGLKWDYDYVKDDQIEWYRECVEGFAAENAAIYETLGEVDKEAYAALCKPKSLMFMHIPLTEVKAAYDEYVANGRADTENVQFIRGNDGESDEVVYSSRTDVDLFEEVLALGSTTGMFFGHDHLNNFSLVYRGILLSYGYSIDYLAYDGIDGVGYQRGCVIITCDEMGNATVAHENYYQDKYAPLYEKEEVDMSPDALK